MPTVLSIVNILAFIPVLFSAVGLVIAPLTFVELAAVGLRVHAGNGKQRLFEIGLVP